MNPTACEQVRDLLPELIAGRLESVTELYVRSHLERCAECRVERALAEAIAGARLSVPAGLEQRIHLATANRRVSYWTRGRMAAAATFAVALIGGSALIAPYLDLRTRPVASDTVSVNNVAPAAGFFSVEEAFHSGAASLRDLTEEELKQLLAELDS